MTEKRFEYNVNKNTIEQNGKFLAYMNCVDGVRIANKLNELMEENEQLKQQCERHRRNFRAMEDVKCELAEENNELKEAMKRMMIEMMGGKP